MADVLVQAERDEEVVDVGQHAQRMAKAISIELRRAARKARVVTPVVAGGSGFQARPIDKIFRNLVVYGFFVIFAAPSVLSGAYLSWFAADQFVSEARFAIRSGDSSPLENLAGLSSMIDTGAARDGLVVADYVESTAMIDVLSKDYDLRAIFGPGTWDRWAEFDPKGSAEDLLDYWKSQVSISVDRVSGLVTLKIRTFSPDDSRRLITAIIDHSEQMVNKLTRRNEEDTLMQAQQELERSKHSLELAVSALRDARSKLGILDVSIAAKVYGDVLSELRLEQTKVGQQILALRNTNSQRAPQLVQFRARSRAIQDQIVYYEGLMAGGDGATAEKTLAENARLLSQKEMDQKIAQSEYTLAMTTFERARIAAERQRSYLQTYISPTNAEESLYPRRLLTWVVISVAALLGWAAFYGMAILVRDNTAT
ncbi:hypothetical protein [Ensifer adhaerens]|uniref:hypothetical protein n=1 Tax=Ensifer adhaerens TaxID=106592 RepID=UPI003F82A6E5